MLTFFSKNSNRSIQQVPSKIHTLFNKWKVKYGKLYSSPSENDFRFLTFTKRYKRIKELNSRKNQKKISGNFGINYFADNTLGELPSLQSQQEASKSSNHEKNENLEDESNFKKQIKTGSKNGQNLKMEAPSNIEEEKTPRNMKIDFLKKIPRVKNQKKCGSCWAHSASYILEALFNGSTSVSPQHFMNCNTQGAGCHGGDAILSTIDALQRAGYASESKVPYLSRRAECYPTLGTKVNNLDFLVVSNKYEMDANSNFGKRKLK